MTIEFLCPACNESIEAPDNSSGKRAKCPRCSEALIIPEKTVSTHNSRSERKSRRGRPDEEPSAGSRPRSSRRRRPDEYDDERSGSRRKRRPDNYEEKTGPNMMLIGGGVVVVLAIVVVLIFIMRGNKGGGSYEQTGTPTVSGEAGLQTNTPAPSPKIDVDKFMDGLKRISNATPLIMEPTIVKYANDVFHGGKASLEALIENGISSDDADITRIADKLLAALTNQKSQIDLLYSDEAAKITEGKKFWTNWWTINKGASLAELIRPGLDPSNNDRGTLAIALGEFQDVETVPFLFDLISEKDLNLRSKAFSSLKRLLKNDKYNYSPDSSMEVLAQSIKEYRDWWDGVKGNYDFKNPEKFLP